VRLGSTSSSCPGARGRLRAEQVLADRPGAWLATQLLARRARRVGVYGLDDVMCVRRYIALAESGLGIVAFDGRLGHAKAPHTGGGGADRAGRPPPPLARGRRVRGRRVEFTRPLSKGPLSPAPEAMLEAYDS
jgi:hypothetical protein